MRARLALCLLAAIFPPGCYEQEQTAVLNPDGSGKVTVEIRAAVPAVAGPGRGPPSAREFGRQLARDLVNKTQGVEGWTGLTIEAAPAADGVNGGAGGGGGIAVVRATAYFSHVSRLKFAFPLVFSWKPREDGNWWLGIERERGPESRPALNIDDARLKQQVTQAQAQYREQQPALQTALSTFKVTMRFVLPGEIAGADVMTIGEDRRSVTLSLEGKKISAALDKFMADDATVAATIRSGNDLLSNDDFLLDAMFGRKGPVGAVVHVAPGAGPAFDYERESRAAMAQEAQMLRDAGVETVPQVIVRPSTRPR